MLRGEGLVKTVRGRVGLGVVAGHPLGEDDAEDAVVLAESAGRVADGAAFGGSGRRALGGPPQVASGHRRCGTGRTRPEWLDVWGAMACGNVDRLDVAELTGRPVFHYGTDS